MLLIIDSNLKDSERKLLDSHCSVCEVNQDDLCSWIDDLPKVDIYLLNINQLRYCERSYGMCWLEVNMNRLEEKKIDLVYYRKTSCIEKKNLPRLKSYIIKTFPVTATSKEDLFERLKHESLPYVRSGLSFCCACCCNKISMGSCLKGCIGSIRWMCF